MKPPLRFAPLAALFAGLLFLPALSAQTVNTAAWSNAVASFAQSTGPLTSVTIPAGAITETAGTARYYLASAGLLLAAANQAPAARRPALLQAAVQQLLQAEQVGFTDAQSHGACAYLLGCLTEQLGGSAATAEGYYQEAVSADPNNQDAAKALAYVKTELAGPGHG